MNELMRFEYDNKPTRVILLDGDPWFLARDVCDILGIYRTQVRRLDVLDLHVRLTHTPSGDQKMLYISESGLYELIFGCRNPNTKKFKKWVTHDILPAIRKKGYYAAPENRAYFVATALVAANSIIEEQKHKVEAFDAFLQAGNAQSMSEVARLLGIGRNTLFAALRRKKVLMKNNTPYQNYMHYFEVHDATIPMGNDLFDNKPVTRVLPEGIAYIRKILNIPAKEAI